MKTVKSTISYSVPSWNFCNVDHFDIDASLSKRTCRFCVKAKGAATCLLYNETLSITGDLINKTRACCKATAGFPSTIDSEPTLPQIDPKDLIKQSIELYSKTVEGLVKQGYPRPLAEKAAKKHVMGE